MSETIHIYHTNDLHSHFTNWPSIKALLTERKRWHEEEGDFCLILDIGDHVDRSHPFSEGTAGKGNVELLNDACYDAATIGNNEGITLSKEELGELYVQADFDVIVGNLKDADGAVPSWAKPYHIIETKGGVKIGLVGATAEFTPFYKRLGWKISDGKEAIIQAVEDIKGQTDLIICLSHLGVKEDELLAEVCPDIDVILGAHTHHIFHEGKMIGNTLLGAAGKFGAYIGHVTIENSLKHKKADLIETSSLRNPDESFDECLVKKGKEQLMAPIFYNEEKLKAEWFKDSMMSELFGQALIEFAQADCALFNAGIFMGDMQEGEMTRYDFHKLLPHPINPCLIELTGAELKEIYLQSLNEEWPHIELKGLGFRGAIFGKIIHANMKLEGHRLYVNGELVLSDQLYRLITLDLFTFGYFFPALKRAPKTYFMPEFLRDVFSQFFQSKAIKK
ncbi:bifunctional metallophosphatase/5'-nucleotidase [Planococcus sp. YIM B11945]|uniref:bifunctional metallophosphatase/5'-nucleotidase n=1 Tax=Planococcus sp. YIM B11945 TaxID=3435410 RepID=UPI003D7E787A